MVSLLRVWAGTVRYGFSFTYSSTHMVKREFPMSTIVKLLKLKTYSSYLIYKVLLHLALVDPAWRPQKISPPHPPDFKTQTYSCNFDLHTSIAQHQTYENIRCWVFFQSLSDLGRFPSRDASCQVRSHGRIFDPFSPNFLTPFYGN